MSRRQHRHKRLLMNLDQRYPRGWREFLPREDAYEQLKQLTRQDFGYNIKKWILWFEDRSLDDAIRGRYIQPKQTKEQKQARELSAYRASHLIDILGDSEPEFVPTELKDILAKLKSFSEEDFGYDITAWKQWESARKGSSYIWSSRLISALEIQLAKQSYDSPQEVVDELKQLTGKDFGFDTEEWRYWERKNSRPLLQRKKGEESLDYLKRVVDDLSSNSDKRDMKIRIWKLISILESYEKPDIALRKKQAL